MLEEGSDAFARVLAADPSHVEAQNILAHAFDLRGRLDDAESAYRKTLELRPGMVSALGGLANLLRQKGELEQALMVCDQAIGIEPDCPITYNHRHNILKDRGSIQDALDSMRHATELEPNDIGWHSNLVYGMQFSPVCDEKALLVEQLRWNERHALPLRKLIRPHLNVPKPDRRLRLGYVSPYFFAKLRRTSRCPCCVPTIIKISKFTSIPACKIRTQ